jgi:DNA modification methylase
MRGVARLPTNYSNTLQIEYLPIEKLTPYAQNARTNTKAQIRKVASSIRAFDFTSPILIDAKNTIVAGHCRVEAAKLVGLKQVPTVRLESLTPAQVQAYVIADNQLAIAGAGWNADILKIELQSLIVTNEIDVALTGFEVAEIDLILSGTPTESEADDELPEESAEVITRLGDLWHLGKHRLLCGDVRSESSLAALMKDDRAALIFTDPPYNTVIEGNVSGKGIFKHGDFAMAVGEMSEAEFTQFLEDSLGILARYSDVGSVHFVCMDWRHMGELLAAGRKVYEALLNVCCWVKDNGGQGSFYRSRHEMVFVFRNGNGPHRNNIQLGKFGRYRTNVWEYPAVRGLSQLQGDEGNLLALHPTVKPVALVADAILDCSARGDLVLDGFLGSGSTLIACERAGRVCYGVELDPAYVDVAMRRWQRHTGDQAVHAATGQSFDDLAAKEVNHG